MTLIKWIINHQQLIGTRDLALGLTLVAGALKETLVTRVIACSALLALYFMFGMFLAFFIPLSSFVNPMIILFFTLVCYSAHRLFLVVEQEILKQYFQQRIREKQQQSEEYNEARTSM